MNIFFKTVLIIICPFFSWANDDLVCITPTISQSPSGTVCQGVYVSLTATGCTGVAANISWYKNDPNSTSIGSGDNIWQSASTVGSTTYYAKCISADCPNPTTYATHTLQVSATPSSPTWVIGSFRFCANQTGIYQVTEVSGLTYSWSNFPVGSIVTPLTTSGNKVSVTFPASFSTGYAQVKASNGTCESAATNAYYEYAGAGTPQPAAFTQSTANICKGQTYTYTVPNDANVSNYTWQYIDSQGNSLMYVNSTTNTANVFFPPNAVSGILRVSAYSNGCNSPWRQMNVTVRPIPTEVSSFVLSPANVCSGATATFEVSPVSDVTSYIWSYSGTGATIQTSGTSASFTFAQNATSGNVSVKTSNGYCESGIFSAYISITQTPNAPSGWTSLPSNFCQGQTYSLTPINDGFSKSWSYTGNGIVFDPYLDNAKTIRIANDATNGILSVSSMSGNCKSQPLSVTINLSVNCCNAEESKIVQDESISFNAGSGNLKLGLMGRKNLEPTLMGNGTNTPYNYKITQSGLMAGFSQMAFQNTVGTCNLSTTPNYYEIIPFYTDQSYNFSYMGTSSPSMNASIYEEGFDYSSPCDNWIVGSMSQYTHLKAFNKYYLVVFSTLQKVFVGEITQYARDDFPLGKPYLLLPVPNTLYDYTFLAVKNGIIVGFSPDADFSNSTIYTSGSYTIYGLSYKKGSDLNTYVGGSLANFQTAINNQTFCAKLSNNTKSVTITSCSPSAAPIVSTNKLIQCNAVPVTITATGCSGAVKWLCSDFEISSTASVLNSYGFSNTTYISAMCDNNGCLSSESNVVTVLNSTFSNSAEAIASTLTTESGICYTGNSLTLSYPYHTGTSYQWLKDDVAISGAINATYSATAVGKYKVQITEGACSLTSPSFYIKPIPSSPIVNNITIAPNTFGTLTATGCIGGQVNWYDALSAGNKLAMFTNSYNTPSLSATTMYYADCQALGCASSRALGIVNVNNPCPQSLIISNSMASPYQAAEYITTSGTINYSTGNRLYKAGKSIVISPPVGGGYWLSDKNTVFEAKIEGCP